VLGIAVTSGAVMAQNKYDVGASDTEIKVGHINPYSGPASSLARKARRTMAISRRSMLKADQWPQDQLHLL